MKQKIVLLNLAKVQFKNKDTGEVRNMTKMTYAIDCTNSERFTGYSILESYSPESAFEKAQKYVRGTCTAVIETRPLTNGVKYVIKGIEDTVFD